MNLLDLTKREIDLLDLMESEYFLELPIDRQERMLDEFSDVHEAFSDKVDSYRHVIRFKQAMADARKAEASRFAALAAQDEGVIARLKARLMQALTLKGERSVETVEGKVWIQANGGKQPLAYPAEWRDNPASAPEKYHRRIINLDMELMRQDVEEGTGPEGCSLLPRGEHLRVK